MKLTAFVVMSSSSVADCQLATAPQLFPLGLRPTINQQASSISQKPREVPEEASISLSAGKLSVSAKDSSLDQIVRDIALLSGMKISGGVRDERVYGLYGPGDIATILSVLLEGTGNNVLIKGVGEVEGQLVLTPRSGSATPPRGSSDKAGFSSMPQASESSYGHRPKDLPESNRATDRPRLTPGGMPGTFHPTGAQPSVNTQERSPNGIKTPDELNAQLLLFQQYERPRSQQNQMVKSKLRERERLR